MEEGANDNSSECGSISKVIMVKLHKSFGRKSTCHASDEGYDDEDEDRIPNDDDDNEMPMESVSVFLPLTAEELEHLVDRDMLRHAAATRIQAAWRGYCARKRPLSITAQSLVRPPYNLVVGLVNICNNMHRQQLVRMQHQIDELERRVQEESMMRVAFEKAVEDMTILIDQQQTMLYDRIELQRVEYEQKAQQLESRIRKEARARVDMERSMAQVMKQMQELQSLQQRRAKEDADTNSVIQRKLNDALEEVAQLRQQQQRRPPRPSSTSKNTAAVPQPSPITTRRKTIVVPPSLKNNNTTASSSPNSRRPTVVPRTSRAVMTTPSQTPTPSRRPTLLQKR
ncbi:hypothetical protein BX666DRAFT_1008641 [Dichotomocladium elegans]|nr:hypothetical protein BX666DRAFT_1008641 [Dichotomocladium elegans]